jgi:hypothetical protein
MGNNMRKITIIGGGQSGLQLAIGLIKAGNSVRVVQNRTAEDIATGKVMSSQCMFHNSVEHERELGIDFWSDTCPPVDGINFQVPAPDGSGQKAIDWTGRLDHSAYSVDQRVKIPAWMAEFERLGGTLTIKDATIADLEHYSRQDDLVIVALGKGDIGRLFERDAEKSPYETPQRALALTYVTGMTPRPEHSAVCFNLIPGVGEYFVFPALTTSGPCEIMVFEGVPGGPMDCWGEVKTPEQHLAMSKKILETYPALGSGPLRKHRTDRRQRHSRRPLRPHDPQADRHLALGTSGSRPRRRGLPQRSDHRAGLEQCRQGGCGLSRTHPCPWRQAVRRRLHARHVRPVLGLCAVGGLLDQHDAAAAAAVHSQHHGDGLRRTEAGAAHGQRF